jgi:hypothetical protein
MGGGGELKDGKKLHGLHLHKITNSTLLYIGDNHFVGEKP